MKAFVISSITALILCVIITSCQSDEQLEFQRYFNGGKILYQQKCQNCHGSKGEGLSNLIPPLTDAAYLKGNKANLPCMIRYGIKETIITINGKSYEGAMPATDLAPVDIAKVLTFISNSFGNRMGIAKSDQVDAEIAKCN